MQHLIQSTNLLPLWSAGAEQRLWLSMLLATVVLLTALNLLQLPGSTEFPQLSRVVVELVSSARDEILETPTAAPVETPQLDAPAQESEYVDAPAQESEYVDAPQPMDDVPHETSGSAVEEAFVTDSAIDWQAASLAAVQNVLDERAQTFSINPNFDKKRKTASETFRPSEAPIRKEIWDNVEKDYLGRTIWRNGGCYKILDNPSAVNRWVYETFERYMTYCDGSNEEYLIEFDEIPDRYQYLEDEFANGLP